MKKYIYILLLVLVCFGCTRDPFDGLNVRGKSTVSLNFDIPASELVVSYSAADDAARENTIARMDIFVFDRSGAIISGGEGHVVLTNVTLIEGKGRTMLPVTIPSGSSSVERQFCVLVNAPDIGALGGIATLDDFKALEFNQGATIRTTNFVMSDISALNTIDSANATINISLRRAMARVDVILEDKVNNFEITSVRLINVRDKGFTFGHSTDPNDLSSPLAVPTGSVLVNYDKVDATIDELKRNFSARLYCPENYNADKSSADKSTAIIVGGIYKGATTYYRVNLHDNNSDAQVRRNYLYRVNIKGVNGAGNPDAEAAIGDVAQNLDYTIVEWDYSLHSDVIFDGKNYLGISSKTLTMPKAAGRGLIDIVTNYAQSEWTVESCDADGGSVATPSWLTLTKVEGKIAFDLLDNTAPGATPRQSYVKISIPTNSRLKMIALVKQSHTDTSPISFEPQIITASWNASSGVFKSKATLLAAGTKWKVESLTMREDNILNWCRLRGGAVVGSGGTTTSANESFELIFDIDRMSATLLARTAIVAICITDPSGYAETYNVSLTQSGISNALSVGRLYIGKTAEIDVEKVSVTTTGTWSASFKSGNTTSATDGCTWLKFTDESYTSLPDPTTCSGMGSGAIYVAFDACPVNTVRNGYVVVTNGTVQQWIRVHQGDYRTVKINGYEMLDRNIGATRAPTDPRVNAAGVDTYGYSYQWGRRPDGYEALSPTGKNECYAAPSTSAERVTHQPVYGEPAWGKYIYVGETKSLTAATGHWLYPDVSITPVDQRKIGELWDSYAVASNTLSSTNFTSMRTEYDPCPDGWRVPTAREMENMIKHGAAQLKPIIMQGERGYHGRFIASESGGQVCFPTFNNRYYSIGGSFATDPTFTSDALAAGWYWTSSFSATGSPYALRIIRSDVPDVLYTLNRAGLAPAVYPANPTQTESMTGAHLMSVRCVRDRKISEELSVNVRRKTVDLNAQTISSRLTTTNLTGSWSAKSSASWMRVSSLSGSGDATLDVVIEHNNTSEVRQGEVRITTTSGTVASVVVIQLDDSGILVTGADGKKRWWRNRNVGATNPNFIALDDENLGNYYGWGAKVPSRWTGGSSAIVSNSLANSWNLASGQTTGANYPFPIKNIVNDPCPAGWRVPSYLELKTTYVDRPMTNVNSLGWPNSRYFADNNGTRYFLPALGCRYPSVINQGTGGFYWSSLELISTAAHYLTWLSANAANMTNSPYPTSAGVPVRCVQELSDSFD